MHNYLKKKKKNARLFFELEVRRFELWTSTLGAWQLHFCALHNSFLKKSKKKKNLLMLHCPFFRNIHWPRDCIRADVGGVGVDIPHPRSKYFLQLLIWHLETLLECSVKSEERRIEKEGYSNWVDGFVWCLHSISIFGLQMNCLCYSVMNHVLRGFYEFITSVLTLTHCACLESIPKTIFHVFRGKKNGNHLRIEFGAIFNQKQN